jgi:hypothetical protein
MPKVVVRPSIVDATELPTEAPNSYRFISVAGVEFIGGRPQGILKLRLRAILTQEQFEDPEIREIARAILSLRTIDGIQPLVRTPEHFEVVLSRFGTDEDIDAFMSAWQKFINPEVFDTVAKAVQDGLSKGLSGDKLKAHIQDSLVELAEAERTAVKNS